MLGDGPWRGVARRRVLDSAPESWPDRLAASHVRERGRVENFLAIKVPKFNEAAFRQVARNPIDDTLAAFELGPEHLYNVLKNAMAPLWLPSDEAAKQAKSDGAP